VPTSLRLVAEGCLDPIPFATYRFNLNEIMQAYDTFADAANTGRLIQRCMACSSFSYLRGGIQERLDTSSNSMSATPERSTTPVLPSAGSKANSDTSPHRDTVP
jgi:hypothetical protein